MSRPRWTFICKCLVPAACKQHWQDNMQNIADIAERKRCEAVEQTSLELECNISGFQQPASKTGSATAQPQECPVVQPKEAQ